MFVVNCHYCNKDIYLFQAQQIEITHQWVDGKLVPEEISVCYWCSLKEGGDAGTKRS